MTSLMMTARRLVTRALQLLQLLVGARGQQQQQGLAVVLVRL